MCRQRCMRNSMAPLYFPCSGLSKTYSPLTCRNHLPGAGRQARSVPFVRPAKSISRCQTTLVVRAAAEQIVHSDQDMVSNGSSSGGYDLEGAATAATLAVHGGERAGRPRVSGGCTAQRSWGFQASSAGRVGIGWGALLRAASCEAAAREAAATAQLLPPAARRLADDAHRPDFYLHF